MAIYSKNQRVEFTMTIACRVIDVGGNNATDDMKGRVITVAAGTEAFVHEDSYDGRVLPGDIPVVIVDVKELNGATAAVGARAGCIVPFEIENDPDTDQPAFKVYRNMKVALPKPPEEQD